RFDPAAPHPEVRAMVHRWIRGADVVALLRLLHQMLERSGSIEGFLLEGYDPSSVDIGDALDRFSTRAMALDLTSVSGRRAPPGAEANRGLLFLSTSMEGERLQAAESVSAVDGPARRNRSRRLERDPAVEIDRPARYPCHPAGALPRVDALHVAGLEDGRRDH